MRKVLTYEPIMVDKDTVLRLIRFLNQEVKAYIEDKPEAVIDFEWFVRVYARSMIECASIIGEEEYGVGFDLQKIVAYGLSNGALDMMYKADPDTLKKLYTERQSLKPN